MPRADAAPVMMQILSDNNMVSPFVWGRFE
jgi:hypothetical protein